MVARLPVIDSRKVAFGKVAETYARAGADVRNLPVYEAGKAAA
ncbi:hypothetical protein LMG27198_42220 [Methylocystis echinoides]|uniref:Uncharacterized protein n=1 Tax=Methylocystis echinoides TaxID=29468 RepID=A0A9W6GYI1_9HYPH|nr:hypothetical protein LMG27198_42220 [Methylocystis echinoides]